MSKYFIALGVACALFSSAYAENLEIIELAPEMPEQQAITFNWDCDVLRLTTSQRYRPSTCKNSKNDEDGTELQVENVSLESAKPTRKGRF